MLLPIDCFVWQMVSHYACMLQLILADVVAKMAGGMATRMGVSSMADVMAISSRWNSHWVKFLLQFQF